jgi:hypothetical protein
MRVDELDMTPETRRVCCCISNVSRPAGWRQQSHAGRLRQYVFRQTWSMGPTTCATPCAQSWHGFLGRTARRAIPARGPLCDLVADIMIDGRKIVPCRRPLHPLVNVPEGWGDTDCRLLRCAMATRRGRCHTRRVFNDAARPRAGTRLPGVPVLGSESARRGVTSGASYTNAHDTAARFGVQCCACCTA